MSSESLVPAILIIPLWRRARAILLSYVVAIIALASCPVWLFAAASDEIAELTAAINKDPTNVELLKQRAVLFRLESMPADSLADLDHARQLAPGDLDIRLQRGITLSTLRRDREAETELIEVVNSATGIARALALAERASIHIRANRPDPAVADLTAAIAIKPALNLYLSRGQILESADPPSAVAGYLDGIARLGRAPALVEALIRTYLAQGQYGPALAQIDQELGRAQVKTTWRLRRAEILLASGQNVQAQADLSNALAEADRVLQRRVSGIHLLSRAKVFIAMGRLDEARTDLEGCLSLVPTFAPCTELLNRL